MIPTNILNSVKDYSENGLPITEYITDNDPKTLNICPIYPYEAGENILFTLQSVKGKSTAVSYTADEVSEWINSLTFKGHRFDKDDFSLQDALIKMGLTVFNQKGGMHWLNRAK